MCSIYPFPSQFLRYFTICSAPQVCLSHALSRGTSLAAVSGCSPFRRSGCPVPRLSACRRETLSRVRQGRNSRPLCRRLLWCSQTAEYRGPKKCGTGYRFTRQWMWPRKAVDVALKGSGCGLERQWMWPRKAVDVALKGSRCRAARYGDVPGKAFSGCFAGAFFCSLLSSGLQDVANEEKVFLP